jgi:hypothetical protein
MKAYPPPPPVQGATVLHRLARLYEIAIQGATKVLQSATGVLHFPWPPKKRKNFPSLGRLPPVDVTDSENNNPAYD